MEYLTTVEVETIMSNLNRLEGFKCLGRMSDYLTQYKHDLFLKMRVNYGNYDSS